MSEHSAGPWRVDFFEDSEINNLHPLIDTEGQNFLDLRFWGLENDRGNADLIVAAPELLEAAKEAEKLLLPLAESTEKHDRYQVMVLVLRQAIAKAEGEKV